MSLKLKPSKIIRTGVAVSGLCLALSVSMLASISRPAYAWYNDNITGKALQIQTAVYSIQSTEVDEQGNPLPQQSGVAALSTDDLHYYTLTASGDASTGYCRIAVSAGADQKPQYYYVSPIVKGATVNVVLQVADGTNVAFEAFWGQPSAEVSPERVFSPEETVTFDAEENSASSVFIEISETPYIEYTVPERATLETIAGHYGVAPQDILTFNGIDSIAPGDTICIPNPATETPYEPAEIYVVVEGDTLQSIADAHNVPLKALCQWNNLSPESTIYPGMELEIPILYENIQAEPEETQPEETQPEDTQPEETQAEETQPVETQPEETQPEGTQPEETRSEETQPEGTQPEETRSEETQPEETQSEETQPEETQAEETQSEETQPEGTQPEETQSKETQPEETQPKDTQPEETQPEGTQQEETQPEETISLEVSETNQVVESEEEEVLVCGVPRYFQNDYPNDRYADGTIATSGCSVTSLTMVANAITGYDYTVDELGEYFGGRAENNMQRLEIGSETLGLSFYKSENWHYTLDALKEGAIVIALMEENSLFTDSQHFIVLTGLSEDGERIYVNDPNAANYDLWNLKNGFANGFKPEDILLGYSGAWVYQRTLEEIPQRYSEPRLSRIFRTWEGEGLDPEVEALIAASNYPEIRLTMEERDLLAKVIWAEARGECAAGQQAIAEVVLNRLLSPQFGDDLKDVIYSEGQFRSVDKLEEAEPTQAQYQAIERAFFGTPVLNRNVLYFSTYRTNDNVYMMIGNHIFCY